MDVLDLVAKAPDTPVVRGLVDGIHDVGVEGLPLLGGTKEPAESKEEALSMRQGSGGKQTSPLTGQGQP